MERKTKTIEVGNQKLIFETGVIAKQANGSVILRVGDTMVFSTACAKNEASEEVDFFPLRVDYQEKFSAAGKTLSGFIKREGRPTERETLLSRLIDRPLRPMFPDGYYNEVQVISQVLSYDGVHTPDPLAICASAAALYISDIPFVNPLAAVRVGYINGKFIINPSVEEQKESKLDLILAGTQEAILMIEGYCDFLTEDEVLQAIEEGHHAIQAICAKLKEWKAEVGKEQKMDSIAPIPQALIEKIAELIDDRLKEALRIKEKLAREERMGELKDEVMDKLYNEVEEPEFLKRDIQLGFKKVSSHYMRQMILKENLRPDGRNPEQIRPIFIEQAPLPRAHGSSLFTRGETQTIAVCTIGGQSMSQRFETMHEAGEARFYLQYFFPPFSVGEVGRMGPPARREVGHGKLAERSLVPIIPDAQAFPYTIRLESNITESNGSSSMASVCGGCLALMDAGVPVNKPVSGIAMGLILEEDGFQILSDISGTEDALGDMDFKLSGTADHITAFQMDIKVEGITKDVMKKALSQARQGRIHILNKMLEVCPQPRKELSEYAPKLVTLQVKQSKIATIIGPGGKQIRAIIEETGVEIDINDDGLVTINSPDKHAVDKACQIIKDLTTEVEIGKTYLGTVVSIVAFGMFVALPGGKEGLVHISEIANTRIENVSDYFKEGDKLNVKVLDINDRGQIKLSHKATLEAVAK